MLRYNHTISEEESVRTIVLETKCSVSECFLSLPQHVIEGEGDFLKNALSIFLCQNPVSGAENDMFLFIKHVQKSQKIFIGLMHISIYIIFQVCHIPKFSCQNN